MASLEELGVKDENFSIMHYKGMNHAAMIEKDWFEFAKANKDWGEPGISYEELRALYDALKVKHEAGGIHTILETGMCYGTTTRFFVMWLLRHGGELYSCEKEIRKGFKEAMEVLGLWKHIHVLGNSMRCPWDKEIDFLFIDSEHDMTSALGEYMRYRAWFKDKTIVGFHDVDVCPGVSESIKIIHRFDELTLVSESVGVRGAGVQFFTVRRTVNQEKNKIGRMRGDGYEPVAHK